MAKAAGALTAAIVNDTDSPLARASDIVLPMAAGPELSVAATKTFVTSLSAWLHVVAGWAGLDELRAAIERLPDRLAAAGRLDWSAALAGAVRGDEPGEHRTRADARDRARGRPEIEGDLQSPCGGIQRRRIPARSDRAGRAVLSHSPVHADRPGRGRAARARGGSSPQERQRVHDGARRARRRSACPRSRRTIPIPMPSA